MKKVNNKKGFTLAELLVVLAILAVLVAVAIPIFTGAMGNAKLTAQNANKRAIRAAATVEILTDKTGTLGTTGPWYATATVDPDGEISDLDVSLTSATEKVPANNAPDGEYIVEITSLG